MIPSMGSVRDAVAAQLSSRRSFVQGAHESSAAAAVAAVSIAHAVLMGRRVRVGVLIARASRPITEKGFVSRVFLTATH